MIDAEGPTHKQEWLYTEAGGASAPHSARECHRASLPRGADSAAKGGARERGVARQRRSTTRDRGLSGCERAQIPASKRSRPLCKELNRQECALEAVLARLAEGKDSPALKVRAGCESAFAPTAVARLSPASGVPGGRVASSNPGGATVAAASALVVPRGRQRSPELGCGPPHRDSSSDMVLAARGVPGGRVPLLMPGKAPASPPTSSRLGLG